MYIITRFLQTKPFMKPVCMFPVKGTNRIYHDNLTFLCSACSCVLQRGDCSFNKDLCLCHVCCTQPCKLYPHMLQMLSSQLFWAVLWATWQVNVVIVKYTWE